MSKKRVVCLKREREKTTVAEFRSCDIGGARVATRGSILCNIFIPLVYICCFDGENMLIAFVYLQVSIKRFLKRNLTDVGIAQ